MHRYLLALDVGNTNTVVGLFRGSLLEGHWRLTTRHSLTEDEIGLRLVELLSWKGVDTAALDGVAVASVVPLVDAPLAKAVARYLKLEPFFVKPGIKTGMPLRVETPAELGADRLCDAVAAYAKFGGPTVVIDFGTAATWEVVSRAGEYLGGAIAPGPATMAESLFQKAAKLPAVAMEPPPRVIGKATVDSMQCGIFYGYLGLVEGVTRKILDELGGATVVATGGFAKTVAKYLDFVDHVEPFLTLEGLRLLWQKNEGGSS